MAETILISGGRVIDPGRSIDAVGDILIADGRIIGASTGIAAISAKSDLIIDARGMVVCPGFIDLHCHLREPGFENKETISGGKAGGSPL